MTTRNLTLPVQGLDDHDSFAIDELHSPNLRNVRSNRQRIVRAPGGTLLAPQPTPGVATNGAGLATGFLTTPTSTGSQVVTHNLGVTPSILFLSGTVTATLDTIDTSNTNICYGATDGTATFSVNLRSKFRADTTLERTTNLLKLVDPSASQTYTCTFTSWTATTFTVNWTAVGSPAIKIAWSVIGGTGVNGKVVSWTSPGATGNKAVTGVGFIPQLVLHFGAGSDTTADADQPGNNTANCMTIGAMTTSSQWAYGLHVLGSTVSGGGPAAAKRQRIDKTITNAAGISGSATNNGPEATYVSMDADGFTVNYDSVVYAVLGTTRTLTQSMFSVCFSGLSAVKVGSITKPTGSAPQTQAVTGVGFQPNGIFFHSWGAAASNSVISQSGAGGGAPTADGPASCSSGFTNVLASTSFYTAQSGNSSGYMASASSVYTLVLLSSVLSGSQYNGAETAKATAFSMDTDGFTVKWPVNDAKADQVLYVAIKAVGTSQQLQLGVIRNYGDLIVGGGTPTEKIVMLTSKSAFTYTPVTSTTGVFSSTAESYTGTDVQRFSIANGTDSTYGAVAAWSQGKDNIRYYDGTTFGTLITSGTNHATRTLLSFNNRLISVRPLVAGIDEKTQIRWSVNGDYANWSGTGSGTLEIVETSNQALTGGIVLGGRCFLTRARETIELIATGSLSPVFIPEVRVTGTGCIATHSIAAGDVYAFWLGPDEVYKWDGAQLQAVGDRMYNTITALVNYNNLDMIQATVYEPDSQYWLVVPPYVFIYDYRRDIWDWDDIRDFQAIGRLTVQDLITGDIDHSEFVVIGDSNVQTIREDPSITTYLGAPIDSYFETRDYTAEDFSNRGIFSNFKVTLWDVNSLREIRFQSVPGHVYEVGVSTDRGVTYDTTTVTVNSYGMGVAWYQTPFSQIRFRFRRFDTGSYEIHGQWGIDFEESGALYSPTPAAATTDS